MEKPTYDELLTQIAALQAQLIPAAKAKRISKSTPFDTRTAGEVWLAGDVLRRPTKKARSSSRGIQTVAVTFADGVEIRSSTYIDGAEGIAEATRFARTTRQFPHTRGRHYGEWTRGATWIRTTTGRWAAVPPITPCPVVAEARFIEAGE